MAVAEWPITIAGEIRERAVASTVPSTRFYFGVLSLLSLAAFVFNIDNRVAANSLLPVAPPVQLVPPLSSADWSAAYAYHLQDPLFAACGGAVTLGQFQLMYWWEWLRQASLAALAGWGSVGVAAAIAWRQYHFVLPRLGGLVLLLVACGAARAAAEYAVGQVGALSSLNVGQYRHAMDVTFASTALAAILAASIIPLGRADGTPSPAAPRLEWLWVVAILLDIWFGALFAARNAAPFWPSWPGYEGQFLPPLARMTSYSPWWLNFTFNPYTIQAVHRGLSTALFLAALWQLVSCLLRSDPLRWPAVRLVLVAGQVLTGILTLILAVPAALSVAHQIGAVFLLAFSFTVLVLCRHRDAGECQAKRA